jgi:hypothetical protein
MIATCIRSYFTMQSRLMSTFATCAAAKEG